MSDKIIEARLSALESALALPHSVGLDSSAQSSELRARVEGLERQLSRANYRISHLVRGLEELRLRAEKGEESIKSK